MFAINLHKMHVDFCKGSTERCVVPTNIANHVQTVLQDFLEILKRSLQNF